jgi:pimeloyl-ACP methyl ester carboxylesterase
MEIKARGLTFDLFDEGPRDGAPVLLLHGFPQDHREFDLILPRLHEAGLRTLALDQRGYSPGARPAHVGDYRIGEPAADALAVLDELGLESAHVVGHDWGAQVAWQLAALHPGRVRTMTAISVPHPKALLLAMRVRPTQRARFVYFQVFRTPVAERLLSAGNFRVLRAMLSPIGDRADRYVEAMRDPARLTGGLNWYRGLNGKDLAAVGTITVPTTYIWSDRDGVVARTAAVRTRDWMDGDYQLVVLRGISHWAPEQAPGPVADAILARVRGV